MATTPICVRVSEPMFATIKAIAEGVEMSPGEWMRETLYRAAYGEPQTPNEGFAQGRRIALQIALRVVKDALDSLPDDSDEAMAIFRSISGKRRGS